MTIEHDFGDIDTAIKALDSLGFSLDGPFLKGKIYHVVPSKITDDYPTMRNSRTPRFVAFLNSKGKLTFDEPDDKNPVLIGYQERLKTLTEPD